MCARLAKNVEAEAQACEIRLRAERRAGQLLRDTEKAQGKRTDLTSSHDTRKSLSDLGAVCGGELRDILFECRNEPAAEAIRRAYEDGGELAGATGRGATSAQGKKQRLPAT